MAESGMESYALQPRRRSLRALWHTVGRQFATRVTLAGIQATALFGLLLLLQFAAGVLTSLNSISGSWLDNANLVMIGALVAPPALLALWTVFGPQRFAVRLPLSLWLIAAFNWAIAYGVERSSGQGHSADLMIAVSWGGAFCFMQAPLWALRAVRRWRLRAIAVDSTSPAASATPTAQFTLRALLGWTLSIAVSLAALRFMSPPEGIDPEEIIVNFQGAGMIAAMLVLGGLPVMASAWILLADGRRLILRAVLTILVLAGLGIALAGFWISNSPVIVVCIEAGAILNGRISLGVARACGYRLCRPIKKAANAPHRPAAPAPFARRRFAVAAVPLLTAAAGLSCLVPHVREIWRRADETKQWRQVGVEVGFDDAGRLTLARIARETPSDDLLRAIARLPELESVDLSDQPVDRRQLALLTPLSRLRSLTLACTQVTDADLDCLVQFPDLNFLDLTGTAVTDAGMERLKRLSKLTSVHLNLTDLSDAGLATLADLPKLQVIEAELTAVTKAGAAEFLKKRPRTKLGFGASDSLLAGSLSVRKVVYENRSMGGYSMGIAQVTPRLQRLHASGKTVVNGRTATVTDAGLARLADQTELEEIDLRQSGVTDQGLAAIAKLKSLKRLDVRGTAVTAQGAARLVQALPDCEVLR